MKPFQQFPIYRYTVRHPSGPVELITFLSPQDLESMDAFPPEVIVGQLVGPGTDLTPDNFARNRAFVDFLHEVIRKAVPEIEEYAETAKQHRSGWLHIHDTRAFDVDPEVAARDIIGGFRFEDGKIIPESYVPNPYHTILSGHGMFTPHPEIQGRLSSAMRECCWKPETPE